MSHDEPGEVRVRLKCGHCARVVGEIWGHPEVGSWRTYDPRGRDAGRSVKDLENRAEPAFRMRYSCSGQRCSREYVVRVENLTSLFQLAASKPKGRRVIMLPINKHDVATGAELWRRVVYRRTQEPADTAGGNAAEQSGTGEAIPDDV